MTTIQITLPDALAADAASLGLLAPERMEAMLREELEAHGALSDAIREGDESGPSIPAADVFAEIRDEIARLHN